MVIKAHGSSNRHAISNAIAIAARVVEKDFRQQAQEGVAIANQQIKSIELAVSEP
jgi:fatty acid/phospholipid biosynthesis enzyme